MLLAVPSYAYIVCATVAPPLFWQPSNVGKLARTANRLLHVCNTHNSVQT